MECTEPRLEAIDVRPAILSVQAPRIPPGAPLDLDWRDRDSWRLVGVIDGTLAHGPDLVRAGQGRLVVPATDNAQLRVAPGSRIAILVFDVLPAPVQADRLRLVHTVPARQPGPMAIWGRDLPRQIQGAAGRRLVAQLELINNAFWRSPADRLRASARLATILAELLDAAGTAADWRSPEPAEHPVDQAKQELVRRLPRLMTVAEMADHVGWSRAHFSRVFRQHTGSTATAFRERIRWREARRLVAESDTPIGHIATLLGYNGPAAFSEACRRRLGASPTSLRAAVRSGR